MHNIRLAGQMGPAETFYLARKVNNLNCFYSKNIRWKSKKLLILAFEHVKKSSGPQKDLGCAPLA